MERGVNDPWLVSDAAGRRWVRKDVGRGGITRQGLLGEAMTWLLGRRVGVPVPDAAVWRGAAGEAAWLSRFLDDAVGWQSWMPTAIEDWGDLGAILALDVVLLNRDRNAANLLIQARPGRAPRAWAIDHERIGAAELAYLRAHLGDSLHELWGFDPSGSRPRGLAVRPLRAPALVAARRFSALAEDPGSPLQQDLREALEQSGYSLKGLDEWTELLQRRCLNAPALVKRYLSARGL